MARTFKYPKTIKLWRLLLMAIYPCVASIIENSNREVLLLLRDDKPDIACPNSWSLVGGHIDLGESAEQAAARELEEEVGLKTKLSLWKRYKFEFSPDILVDQYIFVGKENTAKPEITLGEGQDFHFFSHQDIKTLKIGFGFETILNEYFYIRSKGAR